MGNKSANRESISTAETFAPVASKARVKEPKPGPTSKT